MNLCLALNTSMKNPERFDLTPADTTAPVPTASSATLSKHINYFP